MQDKDGVCEAEGGTTEKPICGADETKEIIVALALAPLDYKDMELVRMWRNDYSIWKWCRQNDFISDYDQEKWYRQQAEDPSIKMYKIMVSSHDEKEDKTKLFPVGVCGLTSIDLAHHRAEFSLYIAPGYQGFNFGKMALTCLISHGFKNLGLHLIWCEVFDKNPAMSTYEELGFVYEGTRRHFYFKDGKHINAHILSIKEDEWNP